jgi:hypothetical protein
MTTTRFIVELPQHNSDREGTLMDIRESITRLIHVSSAIFDRIESRVEEEHQKLTELEAKIHKTKQKISMVASQPSKPCTLIHESKLPSPALNRTFGEDLYSDFPVQKLGEGESDEFRFKNRKNADEDDDPMVPIEALIDLDRRMATNVAIRVRENLEQLNQLESKPLTYTWPFSSRVGGALEEADEEEMGPPPQSLRNQKAMHEAEEPAITPFESKDVGYRPRSKEAHNLGLPTTLGGILPDIAEHTVFSRNSAPMNTKPTIAKALSPIGGPTLTKQSELPSLTLNTSIASVESSGTSAMATSTKEPTSRDVTGKETRSFQEQEPNENEMAIASAVPAVPVPASTESNTSRRNLLAEIREGRALALTKSRNTVSEQRAMLGGATSPPQVKRPTSLADEMREKLARRQKALSGERDEEEQLAERKRKGREEAWDEKSSDSGSSLPSTKTLGMPARPTLSGAKRSREPQPSSKGNAPFAGLDALLNRELATKSLVVPRPPPKPASSVGDWDDE